MGEAKRRRGSKLSTDYKYLVRRHVLDVYSAIDMFGEAMIMSAIKEAYDTANGDRDVALACYHCDREFSHGLKPGGVIVNEIVKGGVEFSPGVQGMWVLCWDCIRHPEAVQRQVEAEARAKDPDVGIVREYVKPGHA